MYLNASGMIMSQGIWENSCSQCAVANIVLHDMSPIVSNMKVLSFINDVCDVYNIT